ncbi:MAG: hypothetical protein ACRDOI_28845 [Trebonia sp.]
MPDGWLGIDLTPGRRERSVGALVDRQFAGIDNAPHLKAQARQELLDRAKAAHAAGGLEMFLSLQHVAGVPLPASLAIFLVPPDDTRAVAADRLAQALDGEDRQIALVDLPAGRAVRVLRSSGSADEPESTIQEVFVPVPGGGWWLLLTFATPFGPLVPAMTKLFDAICATLRWDQ